MKFCFLSLLLVGFCSVGFCAVLSASEQAIPGTPIPGTRSGSRFTMENVGDKILLFKENEKPIFCYVYDVITNESVPEAETTRRMHGCYIHPLYGIDGEILTDDFPVDHYHHHGVFWAWPHVKVGENREYDLWTDNTELKQRFCRWERIDTNDDSILLDVENGWFVGDEKVMKEVVSVRVFPQQGDSRSINVRLSFTPLNEPVTLRGAEEKSYGGLAIRFKPGKNPSTGQMFSQITVPGGIAEEDLPETPLPWADFTSFFGEKETPSGATIFIPASHYDYPPTWLTRHYGAMCVGWPGVVGRTFSKGETFTIEYRLWVHQNAVNLDRLKQEYDDYLKNAMKE